MSPMCTRPEKLSPNWCQSLGALITPIQLAASLREISFQATKLVPGDWFRQFAQNT